jgi:hypothetical protein
LQGCAPLGARAAAVHQAAAVRACRLQGREWRWDGGAQRPNRPDSRHAAVPRRLASLTRNTVLTGRAPDDTRCGARAPRRFGSGYRAGLGVPFFAGSGTQPRALPARARRPQLRLEVAGPSTCGRPRPTRASGVRAHTDRPLLVTAINSPPAYVHARRTAPLGGRSRPTPHRLRRPRAQQAQPQCASTNLNHNTPSRKPL